MLTRLREFFKYFKAHFECLELSNNFCIIIKKKSKGIKQVLCPLILYLLIVSIFYQKWYCLDVLASGRIGCFIAFYNIYNRKTFNWGN